MGNAETFHVADLAATRDRSVHTYEELIRRAHLSVGFSIWPAGLPDTQSPHAEDEVYYVVSGSGRIEVDGESWPVSAGSVVFVAAHAPHRFFDIETELQVVVFWGPAHHSLEETPPGA